MLKNTGYAFLLAVISTLPLSASARAADAAQPAGAQKVTTVEGITEYRLANGLRVLLFPGPSKQTITVNITYSSARGTRATAKPAWRTCWSTCCSRARRRHPNIPKELTERGARPNGTTSFDRTNYFETFPATRRQPALGARSGSRPHGQFLRGAQEDLDTEMTVVRNEFEMGENNPAAVLQQRVMSTAYLWHNYGNSPIGTRTDIENVPIERLQTVSTAPTTNPTTPC